MSGFTVTVEDVEVRAALLRLRQRTNNIGGLLAGIGEILVGSTQQRFSTATAPDGTPWAPNTEVTIMEYLRNKSGIFSYYTDISTHKVSKVRSGNKKGYYRKDGKLAKNGVDTIVDKRPLAGESGALGQQIHYRVKGHTLEVGSVMKYAAMQQFGGTKAQFPHLWGDIPARPFLGISSTDKDQIQESITDYLRLER